MQALDKLLLDEECDTIHKELSHYIHGKHAFVTKNAIRDRGNLFSLEWQNMWFCPTTTMFSNTRAFIGGEHFFCIGVLEHLQSFPKC
jgi:hypothetical protein